MDFGLGTIIQTVVAFVHSLTQYLIPKGTSVEEDQGHRALSTGPSGFVSDGS